jgi:tRNA-dihydrouridine synthase 1
MVANTASQNGSENTSATSTKLKGRQFYESIGSPKYIVAPMVDRSEFVSYNRIPY